MRLTILLAAMGVAFATMAAPEITWLTYRHHFGAFEESRGPVSCDFRFVNTGDQPLTVISARASCGCTTPLYPRESVAPGDTAVVTVAYNPEGRPGRFNKSVTVETDAANMPKPKLTITGVVIGDAESVAVQYPADMGSLKFSKGVVMFGKVDRPRLKTVYTAAYNRSSDSIRPRVVAKPRCLEVAFEPKTVGPGEQITLISYFRAGDADQWGPIEDSVVISTGKEQFALPFTAIVTEDFSKLTDADIAKAPAAALSESTLDFGTLTPGGGAVSRTLTLTNRGHSPLEVRRLYTADPALSLSIDREEIKKGKTATITVTADPAAITDNILNATITLITNDPLNPVQALRAVAISNEKLAISNCCSRFSGVISA